ncbi:hypothetical protein M5K25_007448 [Dendrobium thyrsiflorum]|uniref:Uncharacterized protein n=1 Tax=Dendrobium thyrsiflorum TaxID=117978 RepID=A0ABD0VLK5_DENTH
MVNRRSSRIVGTSRSNSHQSRNQSMNHRRPISASFYPGGQNAAGEGTSGPSLEERIRKMEESHNEILQLLRETRQPALPQREEVFLPRDPPGLEEVQPEHLQAEIPLPPPRRHSQSHQNNEVADTASSTHPNLLEDLAQAHVAEFPRNALRHELRRLVFYLHKFSVPIIQGLGHLKPEIYMLIQLKHKNAKIIKDRSFEKIQIGKKKRDLISAVHSNHSEITPDLSLIYEPCHSQKSINRALISPRRGDQEKKRRRRREEKKERREETPPRPPPDFQVTPEFCPTPKKGRNSARLLRRVSLLYLKQTLVESFTTGPGLVNIKKAFLKPIKDYIKPVKAFVKLILRLPFKHGFPFELFCRQQLGANRRSPAANWSAIDGLLYLSTDPRRRSLNPAAAPSAAHSQSSEPKCCRRRLQVDPNPNFSDLVRIR